MCVTFVNVRTMSFYVKENVMMGYYNNSLHWHSAIQLLFSFYLFSLRYFPISCIGVPRSLGAICKLSSVVVVCCQLNIVTIS